MKRKTGYRPEEGKKEEGPYDSVIDFIEKNKELITKFLICWLILVPLVKIVGDLIITIYNNR